MEQNARCPFFAYEEELDSSMLRLLQRDPSHGEENLSFTVTTVSRIPTPVYTALSYTWGNEGPSDLIYLNGRRFYITKNLWNCLAYFTQNDWTRNEYIWCDAICINQLNVQERNAQVGVMDQIYQNASYVCVWLGLPQPAPSSTDDGSSSSNVSDDDGFTWVSSIAALSSHPYWSRAWIVQEFLLARDVWICCGSNRIGWEGFFEELRKSHKNRRPPPSHATRLEGARSQLLKCQQGSLPSSQLVRRTVFLYEALGVHYLTECKDPRDKVFSLLGLIEESEREYLLYVFPDYTLSIEMVVLLTLAHILCHRPDFRFDTECLEVFRVFAAFRISSHQERKMLFWRAKKLAHWLHLQLRCHGMDKGPYPIEFQVNAARILRDNLEEDSRENIGSRAVVVREPGWLHALLFLVVWLIVTRMTRSISSRSEEIY